MKIRKKILLLLISSIILSCSQESIDSEEQTSETFELSRYDDSNLGVYKGAFTTLDGLEQGKITITLLENQFGTAELMTSSGDIFTLKSDVVDNLTTITELEFKTSSEDDLEVSLLFSVDNDGQNPIIDDVVLNNRTSSIMIAKHMARAPVEVIPGTYSCTNCDTQFPAFGNGNPQTFNILGISSEGSTTYTASLVYDSFVYTSTDNQASCSNIPGIGVICTIEGGTVISGQNME